MVTRGRRTPPEPPADLEPASTGASVSWLSPVRDGEWVNPTGIRWRRRGERGALPVKRVEHLLGSAGAQVLHFYGPDAPTLVPPADRAALWQRMRPYLRESGRGAPGDFTHFAVAEFKDEQRRPLLVIEEPC